MKNIDLAPDGKRIVALMPATQARERKKRRTTSSSSKTSPTSCSAKCRSGNSVTRR